MNRNDLWTRVNRFVNWIVCAVAAAGILLVTTFMLAVFARLVQAWLKVFESWELR